MTAMPPHDTEAELTLLAGLMRCPEMVAPAALEAGVTGADLWHYTHRLAWVAVWELVGCGCGTGPADVFLALRPAASEWGGWRRLAWWLSDTWGADPTGAWCYDACRRVRECALRRRVMHRAMEIFGDARDGVHPPRWYESRAAVM